MTLSEENRIVIIENNIQKSYQSIKDAEILLKSEGFSGALNRIYYSIFYILSALAIKFNFKTSKHTQLIGWFNKNFVKNHKVERKIGKLVQKAFDQRMEGDYDVLSEFCFDETKEALADAKEIIRVVKDIINIH